MSNQNKAHIALFLANFFYGINYIVVKSVMPHYIQPAALVFVRIIPAALLIWFVSLWLKKEKSEKLNFKLLILAAFFGVFLNQFLFVEGLNLTTPIDAAILLTSNPIIVLLVAIIFKKERATILKVIGIFLGMLGAILLVGGKVAFSFHSEHVLGNTLLILNAISFALYILYTKPLMQQHDALDVLKWIFIFGAIMYFPFGFSEFIRIEWSHLPATVFWALFYIVIFTTVLTYLLMNYGIRYLKSTTVSIYIYVQPLVASVLSVLLGFDKLSFLNITAALLVFGGVYLVTKSK